jgi:hypothetical protein
LIIQSVEPKSLGLEKVRRSKDGMGFFLPMEKRTLVKLDVQQVKQLIFYHQRLTELH